MAFADVDALEHSFNRGVLFDQRSNAIDDGFGFLHRRRCRARRARLRDGASARGSGDRRLPGAIVMLAREKSLFSGGKKDMDSVPNRITLASKVAIPAPTITRR